jgi:hypothetical protein
MLGSKVGSGHKKAAQNVVETGRLQFESPVQTAGKKMDV